MVDEHKIKLENNIFHGMEENPKAVEMLENGEYRGKACIVINENAEGVSPMTRTFEGRMLVVVEYMSGPVGIGARQLERRGDDWL